MLAFGLSVALTPLARRFAIRKGQVAEPRADRWHVSPTPLMGGVAIFSAFSLTLIAALLFMPASILSLKYRLDCSTFLACRKDLSQNF